MATEAKEEIIGISIGISRETDEHVKNGLFTLTLTEINNKIKMLQQNGVPTNKWDYGKFREQKELALQDAQKKLMEHKKRTHRRKEMYPPQYQYNNPNNGVQRPYDNPDIRFAQDYIRYLEDVLKCKRELDKYDMSFEGLLLDKIEILEKMIQ
jgi:hypothetical protein